MPAPAFRQLLLAVAALWLAPAYGQTYTVTPLPGLGGTTTMTRGISPSGVVVGFSSNSQNLVHGVSWSGGAVTDLGTAGGAFSYAMAINLSGKVVGYADVAHQASTSGASWVNGTVASLASLGGNLCYAYAVSDGGAVVGVSTLTNDAQHYAHATLWQRTGTTDLGTLAGNAQTARGSSAMGINSSGVVVGISDTASGPGQHATRWTGTTPTDLGTLGGDSSAALAINAAGLVVGYSDVSGNATVHATLWNGSSITDLGTLGGAFSTAFALNSGGSVVGTAQVRSGVQHAVIWSAAGQISDLNSLVSPALATVTLLVATGINDNGQIAVYGVDSQTGSIDSFLLTPSG